MSKLNLVLGQKYKVKGFTNPVVLEKLNVQTKMAYVSVNGEIFSVFMNDILEPVLDSVFQLLKKWLLSLFTKKSK